MESVATYLIFDRNTERAFNFYKSVFGGEFAGPISRYSDVPPQEGRPPLEDKDKDLIMHIELPITGGHVLMGGDSIEGMSPMVNKGNNVYIYLELKTKEEVDRLFDALSAGGKINMKLENTFWGAYYGACTDKFGIQWMLSYMKKM